MVTCQMVHLVSGDTVGDTIARTLTLVCLLDLPLDPSCAWMLAPSWLGHSLVAADARHQPDAASGRVLLTVKRHRCCHLHQITSGINKRRQILYPRSILL